MTETLGARALLGSTVSAVRGDIARCVGSGLAWQAVAVAVPWVLERAVEEGMVGGDRGALWRWSAVLVLLGVVRWAGDAARHWWVERAGAHAADHLRRRLTCRLLAMGDDEAACFGHGDLTARVVDDTTTVWAWVSGIATFATAAFTLLAVVIMLIELKPALALVGLVTMTLAALFSACQVRPHRRAAASVAAGAGAYAGVMESAVAGIRTLKGLGAEEVVLDRASVQSCTIRERAVGLIRVEAAWVAVASAIPAAGIATGLAIGGEGALEGEISVGALVAFAAWMGLLVDATVTFTERLTERGAALAAAGRLAEVLAEPRGVLPDGGSPGSRGVGPENNQLVVDGLAARRGNRSVLSDVNLEVPSGEWAAVLGPTGSGKTTLLRVLAGLAEPTDGTVRIGGVDTALLDAAARRRTAALVAQGAGLVSGEVGEILRLAAPEAADAELLAALEAAGATQLVARVGGLEGRIGDRGLSLSGGERQRLALATAVLRRTPVLLLDDVTSALDPPTENDVLASLRAHLVGVTVVVATHRATTAAACDRAVVLVDGRAETVAAGDDSLLRAGWQGVDR